LGLISSISDFLSEKAGKVSKKILSKGLAKVKSDFVRSPINDCFESTSQEVCSNVNKIQIDLKNFNLKKFLKSLVDENGKRLIDKAKISVIKSNSKYYGTNEALPAFIKNLVELDVFDQKQLAEIIKELGNSRDLRQHAEVLKELVKMKALTKNADSEILEWFIKQKTNYALSFDNVQPRKNLLKILNSIEEMYPDTEKSQRLVNRLGKSGMNEILRYFNDEFCLPQYEELLKAFSKNKDINSSAMTRTFRHTGTSRGFEKQEMIKAKTLFVNLFNDSEIVKSKLKGNLADILCSIYDDKQAKGKMELLSEIFKHPNSENLNSNSINNLVARCFNEEAMASNLDFAKSLLNSKRLEPRSFDSIIYHINENEWPYAKAPAKTARLDLIKFFNEMTDLPKEITSETLQSIIEYNSNPKFAKEYMDYFKSVAKIKGLDADTLNYIANPRNLSYKYNIKDIMKIRTELADFAAQNSQKFEGINKYNIQKIFNEIETTEDVNLVKDFINLTSKLNPQISKQNWFKYHFDFNSFSSGKFLDEIKPNTNILKSLEKIVGVESLDEKLLQNLFYKFRNPEDLINLDKFSASFSKLKNNSGQNFQEILINFLKNENSDLSQKMKIKPPLIDALSDFIKTHPIKEESEREAFGQIVKRILNEDSQEKLNFYSDLFKEFEKAPFKFNYLTYSLDWSENHNYNIPSIKSKMKFLEYLEKSEMKSKINENMSENFIGVLLKEIETDENINSFSEIIKQVSENKQIHEFVWYKILSELHNSEPKDLLELFNIRLNFYKMIQAKEPNNLWQIISDIHNKKDYQECCEILSNIEKHIHSKSADNYLKNIFNTIYCKEELTTFNKLISIEKIKNDSQIFDKIWNKRDILAGKKNLFDIDYCVSLKNSLKSLKQELDAENILKLEQAGISIDSRLRSIEQFLRKAITPIEVPVESMRLFGKNFLANYPQTENILKTFDFTSFGKEGLPLKYSRKSFMADLSQLLKKESVDEKLKIFEKMEIQPKFDKAGNIFAYEGVPNLKNFTAENDAQTKLIDLTRKFMLENEVVSQNPELNKSMNSIIKAFPEYLNFIGKQQQPTHAYSTDIHIMKVLQEAMNHPDYSKLSDLDKTVMKFSILFHDIAKIEGTIDKQHQNVSALYTNNLLEKINMPKEIKNRIVEIVKNHHWSEEFNTGSASAENIATRFRNPQDYLISKIFAQADLKGVNKDFYDIYSSALSPERLAPIEKALNDIYKTGNVIITSRVVTPSKIPQILHQGKTYKVINMSNLADNQDMAQFGFVPGVKKENIRFLTHFIPDNAMAESAQKIDILSDVSRPGVLSTSVLSPQKNKTYNYRKYGFVLESENSNIANAFEMNQGSGVKKNFDNFVQLTTNKNSYRTFLRDNVIKELSLKYPNLDEAEYGEIYKQIIAKRHFRQISDVNTEKRTIKGEDLKQALSNAQDKLFNPSPTEHNEVVVYNPKISGMIFKENAIEDVPQELLDFAHEKNLPIVLFGRD